MEYHNLKSTTLHPIATTYRQTFALFVPTTNCFFSLFQCSLTMKNCRIHHHHMCAVQITNLFLPRQKKQHLILTRQGVLICGCGGAKRIRPTSSWPTVLLGRKRVKITCQLDVSALAPLVQPNPKAVAFFVFNYNRVGLYAVKIFNRALEVLYLLPFVVKVNRMHRIAKSENSKIGIGKYKAIHIQKHIYLINIHKKKMQINRTIEC